jgi:glycosyltransferase involved in cell wall biosynthesis
MKRIAIISSQAFSLVNFRGELIRAMKQKGLQVSALAPDYTEETRLAVHRLGADAIDYSISRAGMNPLRDVIDAVGLAQKLRRLRPDVTLGYFVKPVIYGSLASWIARVPRRFSMIEGLGYVFTASPESQSLRRAVLRSAVSACYRFALGLNARVFFLNPDDIRMFVEGRIVSPEKVIHLDGIGLDLAAFEPAPPVLSPVSFLLTARMLREKGVYEYVDAAREIRRRYPETRFVLVGDADVNPGSLHSDELSAWVKEGLVEWPGHVADVRPWIRRSSVFVLPSYREGLPRSIQEAMAMARPIITTDAPGCRETVVDGENGFTVPVGNSAALADAMIRFIERPELIEMMGRKSRCMAESRFDVHDVNRRILAAIFTASEGSLDSVVSL